MTPTRTFPAYIEDLWHEMQTFTPTPACTLVTLREMLDLLEEIQAYTKNPTYSITIAPDGIRLWKAHTQRSDGQSKTICTCPTVEAMIIWLEAYAEGIHEGYLTAKRGK